MRRPIAFSLMVVFAIQTTGCYSWHEESSPFPHLQQAHPSGTYRVSLMGGQRIELTQVRIQRDSLIGLRDTTAIQRGESVRTSVAVSYPLAAIGMLKRRSANPVGFAAAIAATAVGAMALFGGPLLAGSLKCSFGAC